MNTFYTEHHQCMHTAMDTNWKLLTPPCGFATEIALVQFLNKTLGIDVRDYSGKSMPIMGDKYDNKILWKLK